MADTVGFTPIDAGVAHQAMIDAKHEADERREKMPSSAAALDKRAEQLLVLRNKILDLLPPEFQNHRMAYPDYNLARITERMKPAAALLPDLAP